MAKKHVVVNDLNKDAAKQLSEDDLQKIAGGIIFVGGYGASSYQYANETTYSYSFSTNYAYKI